MLWRRMLEVPQGEYLGCRLCPQTKELFERERPSRGDKGFDTFFEPPRNFSGSCQLDLLCWWEDIISREPVYGVASYL